MKCFDTKKYIKDFFVWHTHTENLVEIRDLSACKYTDVAKAMVLKRHLPSTDQGIGTKLMEFPGPYTYTKITTTKHLKKKKKSKVLLKTVLVETVKHYWFY